MTGATTKLHCNIAVELDHGLDTLRDRINARDRLAAATSKTHLVAIAIKDFIERENARLDELEGKGRPKPRGRK